MASPHGRRSAQSSQRSLFSVLFGVSAFILFALTVSIFGHFGTSGVLWQAGEAGSEFPTARGKRTDDAFGSKYLLGVGKGDVTGPVVEIGFAGYANLEQKGTGVRQRIYSRAFIIGDVDNADDRFVYLVLDTLSGDTAVRNGILEGIAALGDEYSVYNKNNVAVTGTHSHSGPGAWFNYLLPQVTSLGWDQQSYQAIVDGAVLSVKRAHESLTTVSSRIFSLPLGKKGIHMLFTKTGRHSLMKQTQGYLDVGTTEVNDANINRSLFAYMANPEAERAQYSDSTDKTMTLLRLRRESDGKAIGVLTWYAVHPTSMLGNSTHVSGDNKGVAAYLFEKDMAASDLAADGFVAGFSQANVGDTSPNVLGAWCDDGSGEMCNFEDSTCADGRSQDCHGRGPLFDKLDLGVSSCYEIGRRQYAGAKSIFVSSCLI